MSEQVLSNGRVFIGLEAATIREMTFPHVGQDDHALGHQWRLGVSVSCGTEHRFMWLDDSRWSREIGYVDDSLVAKTILKSDFLKLEIVLSDCVDYRQDVYIRQMKIRSRCNEPCCVRLFQHVDPYIGENADGNTVCWDPSISSLSIYKDRFWFLLNGWAGDSPGLHQHACGTKAFRGKEGTWMDAEDGVLSGSDVEQGSVDCVGGLELNLAEGVESTAHFWIAFAHNEEEAIVINQAVVSRTPEVLLNETARYQRYAVRKPLRQQGPMEGLMHSPGTPKGSMLETLADLGEEHFAFYRRCVLSLRAFFNRSGGVTAGVDYGFRANYNRTGYGDVWGRDGAICCTAMEAAGHPEVTRDYYHWLFRTITPAGYFHQKYRPSGARGTTWHPSRDRWLRPILPIQLDETGVVPFLIWNRGRITNDPELMFETKGGVNLFESLVSPVAGFLCRSIEAITNLPNASFDLWEFKHGVSAFTVAMIWAGLKSAERLGSVLGDRNAVDWGQTADAIKAATEKHLYSEKLGRFVRMVEIAPDGSVIQDETVDACMYALWYYGMFSPEDPRIVRTMEIVEERLWVKKGIGGLARMENDDFMRMVHNDPAVPGNPWIITTNWLAKWHIHRATQLSDLERAKTLIDWVQARANAAGLLPEQVHPFTGKPAGCSITVLPWSFAETILTTLEYAAKYNLLSEPAPLLRKEAA